MTRVRDISRRTVSNQSKARSAQTDRNETRFHNSDPVCITPGILERGTAALVLLLLSPLLVLIGIFIIVFSGCPVIFGQRRLGFCGKAFVMYKFRTMTLDVPSIQNTRSSSNIGHSPFRRVLKDPCVTLPGRILRPVFLDELPQLLNVIRGEMRLIGRRPLPLEDLEANNLHGDDLLLWLAVPPGITGPWQCLPRRHVLTLREVIELDVTYQRDRSVLSDIVVLAKTAVAIVAGGG